MAVTLGGMRTAVRQMADMEGSEFVSDAELNDYINRAAGHWHAELTTVYDDYFLTFTTATVATGANTIALPDDFLKLRGVDYQLAADPYWMTLRPFNFERRNDLARDIRRVWGIGATRRYRLIQNAVWLVPEADASGTYRVWYLPRFAALVDDTDEIGDWEGWHELIILEAAIKCLDKEESSADHLRNDRDRLVQRIRNEANNRNAGDPETVADVQGSPIMDNWWGFE